MTTMIDKLKILDSYTNIPTVGFQTLMAVLVNAASGAADYEGTSAEAAALLEGITVTVADNVSGTGAVEISSQYVKVRTEAGTKNAFLEVVLTDAYVTAITLPSDVTAVTAFLTSPAHSQV